MKASSRKILKKIGAGLMLGLSLFNLGAAWNKAEGLSMIRGSKKLRVKEKDQIDSEMAIFAEIAEEEAENAIKEMSASEKGYDRAVEKEMNIGQKVYRAGVVGVLSIATGVFVTSMLFNMPFALGKGMLSLLPGSPHLAVASLSTNKKHLDVGEELIISVNLDSAGDRVDRIKLVTSYDPNLVSYNEEHYQEWEVNEKQISANKRELVIVSSEETFNPRNFSKEEIIVQLKFNSKKASAGKKIFFPINQSRSIIISKDNGISRNILGIANGINISFSDKIIQVMKCQKIKDVKGSIDFWKNFVRGDYKLSREGYWQGIDDSMGMLCSHNNSNIYLSIVVPHETKIDSLNFMKDGVSHVIKNVKYFWNEDDYDFYLYQLSSGGITDESEIRIIFKSDFFNKKEWPLGGSGRVILE